MQTLGYIAQKILDKKQDMNKIESKNVYAPLKMQTMETTFSWGAHGKRSCDLNAALSLWYVFQQNYTWQHTVANDSYKGSISRHHRLCSLFKVFSKRLAASSDQTLWWSKPSQRNQSKKHYGKDGGWSEGNGE